MIEKKKTKLTALASYWLRHFRFSSESTERNSTKLDRKQNLNVFFYYVCVLQTIGKQDSRLASAWLRHLRLLLWNHLKEFNEAWQETRSQLPYQVCVFRADKKKTKMAALASDWLRHFRLLLWNHWTEFNEPWQEARSHRLLLQSLCFTDRSENKMTALASDWLTFFFTSPLNPLNWIQRNLIVIVIWTPLSSFFRTDRIKQRWPPLAQIGWDIYNFSSETTERNSTKLGRKQDLNVFFYQVCVLRTDRKTRWPPCPWLVEIFPTSPLKPLNGIQRTLAGSKIASSSFTKFVFYGPIGKQDGRPGLWLADIFFTSPLNPLNWIQRNLIVIVIWTPLSSFFSGLIG